MTNETDAILGNLAKTDSRLQAALASLRLAQYAAENRGMTEAAKRLRDMGNEIAAAYIEMQALAGELLSATET